MNITLRPYPACKKGLNEVIDLFNGVWKEGDLPFASVHIDLFWNTNDRDMHDRLYRNGETIVVELVEKPKPDVCDVCGQPAYQWVLDGTRFCREHQVDNPAR